MYLTYAYGQLPWSKETSKHCYFYMVWGKSTGTDWFKIGFYGLTTMPAEFQRVMNSIITDFLNGHAFINDIIVLKSTEIEDIALVQKIV